MATSLKTHRLVVALAALFRPSPQQDLGVVDFNLSFKETEDLTDGSGDNQANTPWEDERTLTASQVENLDLANGGLTNFKGETIVFTKVKEILIKADPTNTGNIDFGGHATAAFVGPFKDATDKISLPPGGILAVTAPKAGWTVTATTADMLRVENLVAANQKYKIVLVGVV